MIRATTAGSALAATAIVLVAFSAATPAEEPYRCACCAAHFGKNPNAPTFWRKSLGFGRLMRDHKYQEVLARFDYRFRKNDYDISDVGWVGEALFALGALKSGKRDPLRPYMYVRNAKPVDPVTEDVAWMHEKYGRKIWDAAAIAEYGGAALCATGEVHRAYPHEPRLLIRYLSTLVATGHFDEALREVVRLPPDGLTYVDDIGEFLAKATQEYIGTARYEEGAAYLAAVKKAHGISQKTRDFWVARLVRGVQEEKLSPGENNRLLAKIRAL
jgi:hypothetical protein